MLFGGMPSMGYEHTLGKKDKIEAWDTKGSIESSGTTVNIKTELYVKDRNILNELDNLHQSMLLLPRDQKLEEKYPELKDAYDAYQDLYKGIILADKMSKTHD